MSYLLIIAALQLVVIVASFGGGWVACRARQRAEQSHVTPSEAVLLGGLLAERIQRHRDELVLDERRAQVRGA